MCVHRPAEFPTPPDNLYKNKLNPTKLVYYIYANFATGVRNSADR